VSLHEASGSHPLPDRERTEDDRLRANWRAWTGIENHQESEDETVCTSCGDPWPCATWAYRGGGHRFWEDGHWVCPDA
jgi:hypothetical protein